MLGATETSKYPEVAPAGIVVTIDVLVHELTVIGAPFSMTKLPPSDAPKPVPVICTWPPIDPVVADTAVIAGAGLAVELTDTLSKVALWRVVVEVLLTIRPRYTFWAIVTVTLVPDCNQFTASVDVYPVNVLPLRTNFTQYGRVVEYAPFWTEMDAPVVGRSYSIK
jgi:hypothetical protein